jgi:hypothetical protein
MAISDMVSAFFLAAFGIFFIVKGEVPIMKDRVVKGSYARILGGIALLAAPLYLLYGEPFCTGTFILIVIIGFITSKKTS